MPFKARPTTVLLQQHRALAIFKFALDAYGGVRERASRIQS